MRSSSIILSSSRLISSQTWPYKTKPPFSQCTVWSFHLNLFGIIFLAYRIQNSDGISKLEVDLHTIHHNWSDHKKLCSTNPQNSFDDLFQRRSNCFLWGRLTNLCFLPPSSINHVKDEHSTQVSLDCCSFSFTKKEEEKIDK